MFTVTIMGMVAVASMALVSNVVATGMEDDLDEDPAEAGGFSFDLDSGPVGDGMFYTGSEPGQTVGEGDLLHAAHAIAQEWEADPYLGAEGFGMQAYGNDEPELHSWDAMTAEVYSKGSDSYAEMLTGVDRNEVLDDPAGISAAQDLLELLHAGKEVAQDAVEVIADYDTEEDVILYVTEDGTLDTLSVHYVDPSNPYTDVHILDRGLHVMTVVAAGLNFGLRNIIPLQEEQAAA